MKAIVVTILSIAAAGFTTAQTTTPPVAPETEFPPAAEALSEEALRARVAGKVFKVQYANGTRIRLDVRSNGYAYVDSSSGFRDTGRWRVSGSTWCDDWQKAQTAAGCNEMRVADGVLLLKRRSNGEVVAMRE